MKVQRERYLEALKHRMHNGLVKIITGIRRSGKSYLLSVLFKEHLLSEGVEESHIIEVPLDRDEFRTYRDAIALGDYVRSRLAGDGKWNYVFIDEVQLARKILPDGIDLKRIAPEDRDGAYITFYDTLNGLRQLPNVDVYVTGSNSKTLSSDIDTNFADRGSQIRMHPFSFAEYCEAVQAEDKLAAFDQYLVWGGMPLAVAESDDSLRAEYLKKLYSEVYINDIRKRNRLRDDHVLSSLIDVVSSAIGSLTNPHKLVDTLRSALKVESTDATIAKYLGYLEDAFLFSKASRWDVKGKRYFDYPMKYYAEDIGLRNARLNFRDVDRALSDLGTQEATIYFASTDFTEDLSVGRVDITKNLAVRIQKRADALGLGVKILSVDLNGTHPPVKDVASAFQGVFIAEQKMNTEIEKAESYKLEKDASARIEEMKILQEAKTYSYKVSNVSASEAQEFISKLRAYNAMPAMFKLRTYLSFLETDCADMRKYIISSAIPYQILELNAEEKPRLDLIDADLGGEVN